MQQILIGIILVLGLGSYLLYQQNLTLQANNKALEGAIATQEEAIASLQNDFALQTTELNNLSMSVMLGVIFSMRKSYIYGERFGTML